MRDNTYSRVIAGLKIALPLIALALLSTVFLLSRNARPTLSIPVGGEDLFDRAGLEQITTPFYSGTTADGTKLAVSAAVLQPGEAGRATAEGLRARFTLPKGTVIILRSDSGRFDEPGDLARLEGNVDIASSVGYRLKAGGLVGAMSRLDIESTGPVEGSGPPGTFTAGRLHLSENPRTGAPQMLFTEGVNLVYRP